ncbi:FtsQ-type POTRA domain-containing protein [Microbacterium sp. H1-D42]|uniref:FtsQ-type POTRA domain-containing protein n=1 Tax=Microbacterium sp. H1-D42 TaxID=2925844 RepID=UPI001F53641B|nr:FtsQ-type POTRA domain-containing protein [Microbacterium sp. H1-D42]UNK72119.1 FtsQ-type POTRA domain-containing protein [Microbacterium sp. H1-D42]
MRRPAPLPASADEPARGAHRERVADERADARLSAESPSDAGAGAAWSLEREDLRVSDAATAVIDDAELRGSEVHADEPGPTLRGSDIWRAARARRRALRAEIRRFTQRSRRRRIILWGSIGAVVALVLGSIIAAYSPLFAVREITVAGAETVDPVAVQQALAGQIGSPLALVDASAVKSALTEFPMIETYALEARPPHELLVRIVERTPIGVIESDAGFSLVDAAGVVLSTTPEPPKGQAVLEVSGGIDSPAFRSAGLVMRSLPADIRGTVTEVRASSGDDVTLKLQDGKTIVWGSDKDSVRKAEVLVRLIAASPNSSVFDVSSPTVPVVG